MTAHTVLVQADFGNTPLGQNPAVWTDITRFARLGVSPAVITKYRTDELATVAPSTLQLTLDNGDLPGDAVAPNAGRFTPGNSGSPWASGLNALFRIRFTANPGTGNRCRFDGYVDPLSATWLDGDFGVVSVNAVDWLGLAGTMTLQTMLTETLAADLPVLYLTLTDVAAATTPATYIAPSGVVTSVKTSKYGAGTVAFATGATPAAEGTTSVTLTQPSSTRGNVLDVSNLNIAAPWTNRHIVRVAWAGTGVAGDLAMLRNNAGQKYGLSVDGTGHLVGTYLGTTVTSAGVINDGKVHDLAFQIDAITNQCFLWIDGNAVAGAVMTSATATFTSFQIGGQIDTRNTGNMLGGAYSHAAVYINSTFGQNRASVTHYPAGATGFLGDMPTTRANRLLSFRPNPGGPGTSPFGGSMGAQNLAGMTLQAALLECAKVDGGVLYYDPAQGQIVLQDRTHALNPLTSITLNISNDEVDQDLEYRLDTQQVRNDVTITRNGGTPQRAYDAVSQAGPLGVRAYSDTWPAGSDYVTQQAAGWILANQKTAKTRCPIITHDVVAELAAGGSGLSGTVLDAALPLKQVALTNPPTSAQPISLIVQGVRETIGIDVFTVSLYTTPPMRTILRFDAAADAYTKLDSGNVWSW